MTSSGYFLPCKTLIGTKIRDGRFEIIEKLGEGGFGDVYLIFDARKNERFILKFILRIFLISKYCSLVKLKLPKI
jgi:serine/threonine protein kinase